MSGIDAVVLRTATDQYRWALRLHGDIVALSSEDWTTARECGLALDVMLEAMHWRRA